MKNAVVTKHKLDFEVAEWKYSDKISLFRVGTCHGQWFWHKMKTFGPILCILSIINDEPGNGHLDDVFQWFEESAKRAGCYLMIMDFHNERFKQHCIEKRGFTEVPGTDHVVKLFFK